MQYPCPLLTYSEDALKGYIVKTICVWHISFLYTLYNSIDRMRLHNKSQRNVRAYRDVCHPRTLLRSPVVCFSKSLRIRTRKGFLGLLSCHLAANSIYIVFRPVNVCTLLLAGKHTHVCLFCQFIPEAASSGEDRVWRIVFRQVRKSS